MLFESDTQAICTEKSQVWPGFQCLADVLARYRKGRLMPFPLSPPYPGSLILIGGFVS